MRTCNSDARISRYKSSLEAKAPFLFERKAFRIQGFFLKIEAIFTIDEIG